MFVVAGQGGGRGLRKVLGRFRTRQRIFAPLGMTETRIAVNGYVPPTTSPPRTHADGASKVR